MKQRLPDHRPSPASRRAERLVVVVVVAFAFAFALLGGATASFAAADAAGASQAHADGLKRGAKEPIAAFGKRILPADTEPATKAVEMKLGSLGKVGVVLFRAQDSESNYTGWVLVPDPAAPGSYRKEVLPPMVLANGLFEVNVKSIFGAEADADAGPELCVLYAYYRTGGGEAGDFASEVYKWSGDHFVRLEEASKLTVGLRDAGQVRARFAKQKTAVADVKPSKS